MANSIHPAAKSGFGKQVDAYDAARPTYPHSEVCSFVQQELASTLKVGAKVVDLACGTGTFALFLFCSCSPQTPNQLSPSRKLQSYQLRVDSILHLLVSCVVWVR